MDVLYTERLDSVLNEIRAKLIEKHERYGPDNLKKHGLFGIAVRSSDKLARIENLLKDPNLGTADETHRDTWVDLAGYAIQALVLFLPKGAVGEPKENALDLLRKGLCPRCGARLSYLAEKSLDYSINVKCRRCDFEAKVPMGVDIVEAWSKMAQEAGNGTA